MPRDAGRRACLEESRVWQAGNTSPATLHTESSARVADQSGLPPGDSTIIGISELRRLELGRISLADITGYAFNSDVRSSRDRAGDYLEWAPHHAADPHQLPAISSGDDGLFRRQASRQHAAGKRGKGAPMGVNRRAASVPPMFEGPIQSAYFSTVPDLHSQQRTAPKKALAADYEHERAKSNSQMSSRGERVSNHKKWLLRKEGERGNTWAILELLQAGVVAASRDEQGRTACHYAAMNNHSKAIVALANAAQSSYVPHNFEDADHEGATALHYAAYNGALDAAKTILKLHRANIQTERTERRDKDAARLAENESELRLNGEQLSVLRTRIEELDSREAGLTAQIQHLMDETTEEEARFESEHERLRHAQKGAEENLEAHALQCGKLEETVLYWKPISRVKYEAYNAEWETSKMEMSKLEMALIEAVACVEKEVKANGKTKRKLSRQLLQAQQSLRATQEKLKDKNLREQEASSLYAQLLEENQELRLSVAEYSRKVVHNCKGPHHVEFNDKIHARAADGSSPLHWAIAGGQDEMCHVLLECGADSNASDGSGLVPLHWAAMARGHASNITEPRVRGEYLKSSFELLVKGAKCNALDNQGCSPLHYAASVGFTDLIDVLKEWGGDPSLQDAHGANSVHYAMSKGHLDTALALVVGIKDLYAAIHVQDVHGMSALHYANVSGHEMAAEKLVLFCNDLQLKQSDEATRQACMGLRDARSVLPCAPAPWLCHLYSCPQTFACIT